MNRRRSLLCDVFQIDVHSNSTNNSSDTIAAAIDTSSDDRTVALGADGSSTSNVSDFTVDDDGYTILPPPTTSLPNTSRFMRSHSLDVTSLNNSAASRGVSATVQKHFPIYPNQLLTICCRTFAVGLNRCRKGPKMHRGLCDRKP